MNSNNFFHKYLIVFLIFLPGLILAQATGNVRGTIIDSDNGEPIFGATIVEKSTKKFAKSDFDGKYELVLPAGSYEVEYQMYGFSPQKRKITVNPNQKRTITEIGRASCRERV